jgi:hypothetical protein
LASTGGQFVVSVTAGSGCAWTATSQAAWLTVSAGASGTGKGSATVVAAPNSSPDVRTGSVLIAGQTVTVTEQGVPLVQLTGAVSQKQGECPVLTFVVDATTVVTDATTSFTGGKCGDVGNEAKVHVTGIQQPNGTVAATTVQIQKKG